MPKDMLPGFWVAVVGLVVNNLAYLYDLLIGRSMIEIGWKSGSVIAVSFLAVLAGLYRMVRARAAAESGEPADAAGS